MQYYWLEGSLEPLSAKQLYAQRDRITAATRCAVVGSYEWRPIREVIPDFFDSNSSITSTAQVSEEPSAVQDQISFSRKSGWVTFFYFLAVLDLIAGLLLAVFINPVLGCIAGVSSMITCLFFAFVAQLLVDVRWLISQERGNQRDQTLKKHQAEG